MEAYGNIDASAVWQIIFVAFIFLYSFHSIFVKKGLKSNFLLTSPNKFLFLFIVVCVFSMSWTTNIYLTGYRALESLAYFLLIVLVVVNLISRLDYQNIIEWCMLWVIWDIVWALATNVKLMGLSSILWPFNASRLVHPMFFFFALLLAKRKLLKYLIIAFGLLAFSNKIYFGIAFGLLGFLYGNSKYKKYIFLSVITLIIALVSIDVETLLQNTLFYGREGVGITYVSGRDKVWAIAWEAFSQKPITGYGFVSGENMVLYESFKGAINTHNFLLSALLGTGLAGGVLLLMYFYGSYKKAISNYFPRKNWRPAMVSTFIMTLIVSLTSPGIGGRVYGSWIPAVLVLSIIIGLELKFRTEQKHLIKQ